jgi:hypothetical protein
MSTGALEQNPRWSALPVAVAAPARVPGGRKHALLFRREHGLGYVLITPALLILGVLVVGPLCMALSFSITESWAGQARSFVGLQHYR